MYCHSYLGVHLLELDGNATEYNLYSVFVFLDYFDKNQILNGLLYLYFVDYSP